MDQDQARTQIQNKAVKLSKSHRFLCLEWSTGCGKTLAAAKIVEEILRVNPKAKGYLVCKESTHKKNWHDDIKKHRKLKILKNITTLLYASLGKHKDKADFIILDECHALTPKRIQNMRQILQKGTRIIFLSATIPQERKNSMISLCKTIHFDKIPLKKAIELKLLPEPVLIVHKVDLSMSEGNIYRDMTQMMEEYKDKSECLTSSYQDRNFYSNRFLNTGSARKKFIAEVKTKRLRGLVESFREDKTRFICFTGSIDQSMEIGGTSAVHSKNKKEFNQDLIDCFNDGTCSELFAVKMLRESVNLTDVQKGIITQLDSGIGSFYQMLGRCLRNEFPEMHIIVLNGTQDVAYFEKSMNSFDKKYIRIV